MWRKIITTSAMAVAWLAILIIGLPAIARTPTTFSDFSYDPRVAAMMAQVISTTVYDYDAQLSGETAATVGGTPYTITTRNTNSGAPLQAATQYAYEYLQRMDLAVS
jgi:hypothetical protein